jgi:hypothetical protein
VNIYGSPVPYGEIGAVDWDNIVFQPGFYVPVNPGKEINFWTPPGVPPDLWRLVDQSTADIDRISGVNEALTGSTVKAGTSGVAVEEVQENALQRVRMFERWNHAAFVEVGRQMTSNCQQIYGATGAVMRVIGETGTPVPEVVQPDDLLGYYDFEFVANSAYTLRKQIWFKQLMDLKGSGAPIPWDAIIDASDLPDKEQLKKVLEMEEQKQAEMMAMQEQAAAAPPMGPNPDAAMMPPGGM